MPPAYRPDAAAVLGRPADMAGNVGAYLSRTLCGPRSIVRKARAMAWHIWLFRFLLAWNVILLAALIVMVMA
jgi:hypothetical protein